MAKTRNVELKGERSLERKIKNAPHAPGCYLYKDASGQVIYVGKSKELHKRVKQYFRNKPFDYEKLNRLARAISDVEYIVTPTELDALITEYRLIKTYKPRFNSQLKQDVEHPLLRIDTSGIYPAISATSEYAEGFGCYFTCFFDIYEIQSAIDTINRAWRTPLCGKTEFQPNGRACLNYHIGRCLAPCAAMPDPEAYRRDIDQVIALLRGEHVMKLEELRLLMEAYSEELAFEKAEACRVLIDDLERLRARGAKHFYRYDKVNRAILFIRPFHAAQYTVFCFNEGRAVLRKDFPTLEAAPEIRFENAPPISEGRWLERALAEILAVKCFIRLADECEDTEIINSALINSNFFLGL
ncbi:MAG: GIY-YIG nuclease family protein [Clostridiales bacterium]|jgi:excinuclease ABC subunit C|nr:GIY-YIG nuclease family protein [Clostridiales bacterium]